MISESELGGWGFAIDLAAERQVFPEAPELSYYKCFLKSYTMRNCAVTNNQSARFISICAAKVNTTQVFCTIWQPNVQAGETKYFLASPLYLLVIIHASKLRTYLPER